MEKYQAEIDSLERQWADYVPTIDNTITEIGRIDLSMYAKEHQEEKRQKLFEDAKPEIDTICDRFIDHIDKLRESMAKNHFADTTMLKEKQRFAETHNLTLTDAEFYLEKYINTADLSDITDERSPHHKLFMATLAKSTRKVDDAYTEAISKTKACLNSSQRLKSIYDKAKWIKENKLSQSLINSGDIYNAILTSQKYNA